MGQFQKVKIIETHAVHTVELQCNRCGAFNIGQMNQTHSYIRLICTKCNNHIHGEL